MTHLSVGDMAPDISAKNQDGKIITLNDYKGEKLILYFYPRDNTPGCTAEACNLRDNSQILEQKGYKVLGVSPDNENAHLKFRAKHSLDFDLISDTDKKVMRDYGVWGEKMMFGKIKEGVHRTTFIIEEGKIVKIFKKVKTKEHTNQILEAFVNK